MNIKGIKTKEHYDAAVTEARIKKSKANLIKLKCLDCSAMQTQEIKLCPVKDCPLYTIRGFYLEGERKQKPKDPVFGQ